MDEQILKAVDYSYDDTMEIGNIINAVGLPEGDILDKDRVIMFVEDGNITVDDLIDAVVETTNALLKIRNLLN